MTGNPSRSIGLHRDAIRMWMIHIAQEVMRMLALGTGILLVQVNDDVFRYI